MVSHKLFGILLIASSLLACVSAASTKRPVVNKRLAGIYVKDNKNGELRFLASNSQINEAINQKQEFLEQLRPTTTGTGNGVTPIIINTATATATATGTATGTGTLTTGTGTGTGTLTTTGATGGGGGAGVVGPSPIGDLLPQIVAQAALQRRRPGNNRRRVVNKRRRGGNNRRRGNRRGNNRNKNRPQVFVVRPRN
uniref:Uncharacterized protein n=1 Tax=Musca domestica TaxID=7370 RepID=A0A1I8MMK5_MUSDO